MKGVIKINTKLKEKINFDLSFGYPLHLIAGMDEAGRGAWMGPVVSACVILSEDFNLLEINDSKAIKNENKRYELAEKIKENVYAYGIGFVNNHIIEEIGIQRANFKSFQLALEDMKNNFHVEPKYILLDGNYKNVPIGNYQSIVKGDSLSATIACASILAKTERDKFVSTICHNEHPEYLFNKHKGYGTKKHQEAILQYGLTKWHRDSFCEKFLVKHKEVFI